MLKKPLLLAMLVLLSGGLFAQSTKFGIKAGLNIANLKATLGGTSATSPDIYSFHGGFYAIMMTSEKFGFQPEFIYSGQGGGDNSGKFNLNYLNVPVMMRYDFAPGVNIQFGPQVGFLISATVNGQDAKSGFNSVDFGLGFGLGVDRPSGVTFGFRYVIGLSNTLSSATTSAASGLGISGLSMTNQVIQLSLGMRLSKG